MACSHDAWAHGLQFGVGPALRCLEFGAWGEGQTLPLDGKNIGGLEPTKNQRLEHVNERRAGNQALSAPDRCLPQRSLSGKQRSPARV